MGNLLRFLQRCEKILLLKPLGWIHLHFDVEKPAIRLLVGDGVIAASAATQNIDFHAEVGPAKLKLVLWL